MTHCTRPAQEQASQHSRMERTGVHKPPPLGGNTPMAAAGGGPFLFKGVAPGRSIILRWMVPHPVSEQHK